MKNNNKRIASFLMAGMLSFVKVPAANANETYSDVSTDKEISTLYDINEYQYLSEYDYQNESSFAKTSELFYNFVEYYCRICDIVGMGRVYYIDSETRNTLMVILSDAINFITEVNDKGFDNSGYVYGNDKIVTKINAFVSEMETLKDQFVLETYPKISRLIESATECVSLLPRDVYDMEACYKNMDSYLQTVLDLYNSNSPISQIDMYLGRLDSECKNIESSVDYYNDVIPDYERYIAQYDLYCYTNGRYFNNVYTAGLPMREHALEMMNGMHRYSFDEINSVASYLQSPYDLGWLAYREALYYFDIYKDVFKKYENDENYAQIMVNVNNVLSNFYDNYYIDLSTITDTSVGHERLIWAGAYCEMLEKLENYYLMITGDNTPKDMVTYEEYLIEQENAKKLILK